MFEFNKNIVFKIDFFIAINYAEFFVTTFDDHVNKIRREKFIDIIVYWTIHYTNLFENDQIVHLFFVFKINICKINIFRIRNFDYRRNVDDATIFIDFLLISSNVNFLLFFWFYDILYDIAFVQFFEYWKNIYLNRCITFMRFFDREFLLKSSFDLLSKIFLIFRFRNETIETIVFASFFQI